MSKDSSYAKMKIIKDNLYAPTGDGKEQKKVFRDIVAFPTEFQIKVIGEDSPSFVDSILDIVASSLNLSRDKIKVSVVSKGKYISVSISPLVKNADELYLCYDVIPKVPGVRYCL